MSIRTREVRRWLVWCTIDNKWVSGWLSKDQGKPTVCFENENHPIDITKTNLLERIENNYTETVLKWKVYCETDSQWETVYLDKNVGTPRYCPKNNTHIITLSGTNAPWIEETINNPLRRIQEESIPVDGTLGFDTIQMDILPNETNILDKSWDIDIAPLELMMQLTSFHTGDILQIDLAPDTIIGATTTNVAIGQTVLDVTSSVLDNAKVGYMCTITDGNTVDELGLITDIDHGLSQITVKTGAVNNYNAGVFVRITIKVLNPYKIGAPRQLNIGKSKIGASHVNKNTTVRITYINNSNVNKTFNLDMEYLY